MTYAYYSGGSKGGGRTRRPPPHISHLPISGRHRASMVFRHRPDIESISARCRPDIVDDIWPTSKPTCKHGVGPISADICRYRPDIFCRHQAAVVADICRYRADIEPLWFSDISLTSSLYRPDVGLKSLATSGRHRAHVQTWSRPDISRHLPISARYNFRHQADVVTDICRYRADIWPIILCYLGMI